MQCKICHQTVESNNHFHKLHKITIKKYFETYEPKFDLHTKEPLCFNGNIETYLLADFLNKTNLKAYLKALPLEAAQEYCRNYLISRYQIKKLQFAPCHTELRSLVAPNVIFYDKLFKNSGGYASLCKELNLKNRFGTFLLKIGEIPESRLKDKTLIIDSREQHPLIDKNLNIKIEKLDYGDYFIENKNKIYVERKSLSDLLSTISGGYERFKREIIRAQNDKSFLVVIVESGFSEALSFNYLPHIARNTKATPDFIWHRIRELLQTFDNLQFVFVKNRSKSLELIKKIYFGGFNPREFDVQLAIDQELL